MAISAAAERLGVKCCGRSALGGWHVHCMYASLRAKRAHAKETGHAAGSTNGGRGDVGGGRCGADLGEIRSAAQRHGGDARLREEPSGLRATQIRDFSQPELEPTLVFPLERRVRPTEQGNLGVAFASFAVTVVLFALALPWVLSHLP